MDDMSMATEEYGEASEPVRQADDPFAPATYDTDALEPSPAPPPASPASRASMGPGFDLPGGDEGLWMDSPQLPVGVDPGLVLRIGSPFRVFVHGREHPGE